MMEIYIDDYKDRDWSSDNNYLAVLGKAMKRKFQYSNDIFIDDSNNLTELQRLSVRRAYVCKKLYDTRVANNLVRRNKVSTRSYMHRLCDYDDMNELERYGIGKYAREYNILISFEDALDFIYSNILKTRSGSLIEFCSNNGLNYSFYSRSVLGGGNTKNILMNDFIGFSESYDVLLKNIGNDTSLEKRIFFSKFFNFCINLRNILVINCGDNLIMCNNPPNYRVPVIASIGVSSLVYYSDFYIDDEIVVYGKTSSLRIKVMSYKHNDYINVIDKRLSY